MDDKLFVAILAALAALLGSLIPTIVGYLNSKKQREFELTKALIEKQREIYKELMFALQNMINKQKEEDFINLQKSVLQISIYGDNETCIALNKYYAEVVASSQVGGRPLAKEEHQNHQKVILNSMRQHLGLQPVDSFEIVRSNTKDVSDKQNENT